jgi:hypothetical protein
MLITYCYVVDDAKATHFLEVPFFLDTSKTSTTQRLILT